MTFLVLELENSSSEQIFQYVAGTILNLPPSMSMTFPVRYAPARLVRNRIHPAISSSVPTLSKGIWALEKTPSPMIPAASFDGNTVHVRFK
jgi:hypothetical protein